VGRLAFADRLSMQRGSSTTCQFLTLRLAQVALSRKEQQMLQLKKVLVPTDFSAASELALRYGKEMAKTFRATLYVLHVADDPVLFAVTTSSEYRAEAVSASNVKLEQLIRGSVGDMEHVELLSKCGSAASEIIDFVKDEQIDLVVMGSHGHGAIASMLLGNVAEHVVRHSLCPVMTVRSPEHDFR
jgi:nucleotide-binding universal stress UspA family protein